MPCLFVENDLLANASCSGAVRGALWSEQIWTKFEILRAESIARLHARSICRTTCSATWSFSLWRRTSARMPARETYFTLLYFFIYFTLLFLLTLLYFTLSKMVRPTFAFFSALSLPSEKISWQLWDKRDDDYDDEEDDDDDTMTQHTHCRIVLPVVPFCIFPQQIRSYNGNSIVSSSRRWLGVMRVGLMITTMTTQKNFFIGDFLDGWVWPSSISITPLDQVSVSTGMDDWLETLINSIDFVTSTVSNNRGWLL